MKEVFLNKSMDLLSSKYNYDSLTKDKILYGLEIIYIFITKLSVILISALIIILSLSIASLLRYNHYTRKILLGDF